ncbi:MAG: hypothetical protein Q4F97_05990 [Bacteroidales bacterium]|nr:hypothetical protein [Bacteroidales bacterium]
MNINNKIDPNVKSLFLQAIAKVKEREVITLSDLYVTISYDDLILSVYDDEENLLAQSNMDQWTSYKEDPDTFEENIVEVLKSTLHNDEVLKAVESMDVIRPFSVVLVGEDFLQIEELMRLDDNLVVIEDDFIENIDKELDDFLKNLLKDL